MKTNTSSRKLKPRTLVLIILVSFIIIPIFMLLCRYGIYLIQYYAAPERDLDRYCSIGGSDWEVQRPYVVFPPKNAVVEATDTDYLQKSCISPLFFMGRQNLVYLSCNYTEEQYQTEVVRLAELCGDKNTETFALPAYVYYGYYPNGCCEYALLDEAAHTIYYLSFQGSMLLKQYIPGQLRPNTSFAFGKADSAEEWNGGNF